MSDPAKNDSPYGSQWDPSMAMESLVFERTIEPGATSEFLAQKHLRENAPMVAQSLVRIALYSKSETTRLRAGQYVLDRVLGKPDSPLTDTAGPLETFFSEISDFVNKES